ncbi:LysR family transcriptional regulator [Spirochaeta isovalerica]|uniref:DNA-binding transcriptional LysR family regulator n=1 Tax=Spirochaeta isovalerica TaxID=150 RepID=A0A841RBQ6_9SPIO|nr:LysR family transcriptional regulator [Spirochaeta isovalerica]MBB6479842.1 DNA-binding transcriptional LysR family regulator [Spirochaeta isovalerica]
MNTRSLQCFIMVYEKKSLTAAAKDAYISPQGLSKVIKQLETELDAELFFRGTHGMEATESGELLYARARHLCYLMEDIKKEISIINGSRNALNIIATYSAVSSYSLDTLYSFGERNPEIQMTIREYPDASPLEDLFQEQADAGIVLGHERISNCDYQILHSGETVLIVPSGHILSGRKTVSLRELDDMALVVKSVVPGEEQGFADKCREAGITPRIRYESENLASIHHLCEQREVAGISIDFLEESFPDRSLEIVRLEEKIPQNLYFVSKHREIQNQAVELFRRYILNQRIKLR